MADEVGKSSRFKVIKRILFVFVILFICGITACQIHYYRARRTPTVSGRVVDIETGEPIKDTDVLVKIYGFPSDPIAAFASPPKWLLASGILKTDSEGKFSFPSQVPPLEDSGVSWLSYLLWGPDEQIGIGVDAFPKEYITVASESEGFDWNKDPYFFTGYNGENDKSNICVSRQELEKQGFEYLIETKKAITEKDWQIKCHETILHYYSPTEKGTEWLFRDLVGYLEKYPNGEKAGVYIGKAMFIASVKHERAESTNSSDLKRFLEEDRQLLMLADNMPQPIKSSGYASDDYTQNRIEIEKEIKKIESMLEVGGKDG
jgi:hypothetical protein